MVPKKRETNERMSNNFNKGNKSSRSLYSIESHNQTSHAVYHENCKLLGLECTHGFQSNNGPMYVTHYFDFRVPVK